MSEEFINGLALFDADGRLVDWDEGFAREWIDIVRFIRRGVHYGDLLKAVLGGTSAKRLIRKSSQTVGAEELIRARIEGFGTDRAHEYRTTTGRIIGVDERRTASGGIHRMARDITDERAAAGALIDVRRPYRVDRNAAYARRQLCLPADRRGAGAVARSSSRVCRPGRYNALRADDCVG